VEVYELAIGKRTCKLSKAAMLIFVQYAQIIEKWNSILAQGPEQNPKNF
jgi:hypothetical protein